MKPKRKPAERVGDMRHCQSHLHWLRTSPTFQDYLARVKGIYETEEYKRLTSAHKAKLNLEMDQCSPNLALDYSRGVRGWPNNATVFAYRIKSGWAVYGYDDKPHRIYNDEGRCIGRRNSSLVYKEIRANDIQGEVIWLNCPFDKKLNGKPY